MYTHIIEVETLTAEAFAPFGWMLGKPCMTEDEATFESPGSDFWSEHLFDTMGGDPEILWVAYRSREREITRLESHLMTEQAVIPLTGSIIQIVGCSLEDGSLDAASLRAFRVAAGQGICMRPGCWHATRVEAGEITCVMLTRRSTTLDLANHLNRNGAMRESAFQPVAVVLAD